MVLYNLFPERSGPLVKREAHTRVCSHLEITEIILGLLGRDSGSRREKGKQKKKKILKMNWWVINLSGPKEKSGYS